MIKLSEYRGYTVEVDEYSGHFQAIKESSRTHWFSTLDLLKAKIDKLVKAESNKGFPVEAYRILFSSYEKTIIKGKITSYNAEDESLWFSRDKSNREKIGTAYGAYVYPVNEANDALIKQLAEKIVLDKLMREEIDAIKNQLIQWEPTKEATIE